LTERCWRHNGKRYLR